MKQNVLLSSGFNSLPGSENNTKIRKLSADFIFDLKSDTCTSKDRAGWNHSALNVGLLGTSVIETYDGIIQRQ